MSNQEPTEEKELHAVYSFAAEQMQAGVSTLKIHSMLVEKGIDSDNAAAVISDLSQLQSDAIREAAKKEMTYGALWCIGGLLVTVITYSSSSGGGSYIVAWGAIIFGAIQFFRGLAKSKEA